MLPQDSLLYALGVGAGVDDPTGAELEFTTENTRDVEQLALPTQVCVLGGGPTPSYGTFNAALLLHGEQHITLHQPLPSAGTGTARSRITDIWDKGSAAVVNTETNVVDADGKPLWSVRGASFIRGEGGFGGERGPSNTWSLPERPADVETSFTTRTDQALLYRLNGDRNPLHSDPAFAADGGFSTPILHGLCTFGISGRLLLHALCDGNPARFKSMGGQFKSPVLPGQTLTVHAWIEDDDTTVLFQTRVDDRVVFDSGVMTRVPAAKL